MDDEVKKDLKIEPVPAESEMVEMVKDVKYMRETFDESKKRSEAEIKRVESLIETKWNDRDSEKDKEINAKFDVVEKKLNAMPVVSGDMEKKDLEDMQRKAVNTFLRKGIHGMKADMTPDEVKTLSVEDDPMGGYLVAPPFFEMEIIDIAKQEISPVRSIAKVVTLSKENRYEVDRITAHAAASWVADAGTTAEDTTLRFGKMSVPVHEYTILYKAKQTLIEDSMFNLESELKGEYGRAGGLLEGTSFISGNGIGRPEGILSNATIVAACVNSGDANLLKADGLISLIAAPKSIYVASTSDAKFLMNRATMFDIWKLKDGMGQYLLIRMPDKPNWMILGYDVVECSDMPAIAADAYPVAFGNFRLGYVIVDRLGMTVLRDPFTSKTTRVVEFLGRRRVGGGVRIPEAIYIQKVSA